MNIKETEDKHTIDVYPKRDLAIVRGEGIKIYDEQGNEYLDFAAGVGVASTGHANKEVNERITKTSKHFDNLLQWLLQ
jgi:acetylornithine/N-succinyldiaminopimelate aminotransferase